MKTQVNKKNGIGNFEELNVFEMSKVYGGDGKKMRSKTAKEKDIYEPDEQ